MPAIRSNLFSGPYYGPSAKKHATYHGPAMRGVKRILWRAGRFPWNNRFNEHFNIGLEKAISKLQADHGYVSSGIIGERTWQLLMTIRDKDDASKPAVDETALNFLKDDYAIHHPPLDPPIERVRDMIAEWLVATVDNANKWDYTQMRPADWHTFSSPDPALGGKGDCSLHPLFAFHFVRRVTGIMVPDPMQRGYDGYGNTDTLWANWKHNIVRSGNYEVGDIALYGPSWKTKHATTCSERGRAGEAEFTSHGSQAGPYLTRVYYRSDLLAVVRPTLVPITA